MFVGPAPEALAEVTADLAGIGSALRTANAAAAPPITEAAASGAGEVSALIAALFSGRAQAYRQLSAHSAVFHDEFVEALDAAGAAYAAAEAANTSPLQSVQRNAFTRSFRFR